MKTKRIILVACSSTKQETEMSAKDLYCSEWFKKARAFAEANGDEWFIISAKHGLVDPNAAIAPYNETLNEKTKVQRRVWFANTTRQMMKAGIDFENAGSIEFVVLGGQKYAEHFATDLIESGFNCELPLAGLGIGEQLSFFKHFKKEAAATVAEDTTRAIVDRAEIEYFLCENFDESVDVTFGGFGNGATIRRRALVTADAELDEMVLTVGNAKFLLRDVVSVHVPTSDAAETALDKETTIMNTENKLQKPDTCEILPFAAYDKIIVMFSGGKDSLACFLHMLEMGVPKEQIELWHQSIDGAPDAEKFMDWNVTDSYVRAVAEAFGVRARFQWKDGGFYGEMMRENALTRPNFFETDEGVKSIGGKTGKLSTRRMFPQRAADLSVRWCSAYLKIDVAAAAIRNDPRFGESKVLVVTGERRQESAARARYAEKELLFKASNKNRTVHQWRAVIDWTESEVWAIIEKFSVMAHPAYFMGFGRTSCQYCIFLNADGWATNRKITPNRFAKFAAIEREFGVTIDRKETVEAMADKGTPFEYDEAMKNLALSENFSADMVFMKVWIMPSGAFTDCGGSI